MISCVIPIYNAEKIIWGNYKTLKTQLEKIGSDYELIFGDDGSCDTSKDILEEIVHSDSKAKVFSHAHNCGLGFTLQQLFRSACGDIIIYLDIDLPFGVEIVPTLIRELEKSDVVLASKYVGLTSKIPPSRQISSRLYYLICKFLFNINIKDLGSGLVIFKKEVLRNIYLLSEGFDIHIELFAKIKKHGFLIKEVPASYTYNGYSTFGILKHGPRTFIDTLKLWLKG